MRIKGYLLSDELFTTGYAAGSGPCGCDSSCCAHGAYVDLAERERVLAHAELIKPHLDATQPQHEQGWFETDDKADPDYASGRCVGTAVYSNKCALLDARGRCSIQVAESAAGLPRWSLKPLYCRLFPIEVVAGEIRFDPRLQNDRACCSVQPTFQVPLFEACREELVSLIGEDGFRAVQDHYANHYPQPSPRVQT